MERLVRRHQQEWERRRGHAWGRCRPAPWSSLSSPGPRREGGGLPKDPLFFTGQQIRGAGLVQGQCKAAAVYNLGIHLEGSSALWGPGQYSAMFTECHAEGHDAERMHG